MDTTEDGEDNTVSTRRRLRTRPTKVETSNEDSTVSRSRSKPKKRKAEVNIESLYLQETNREVCPTALETIFEAPKTQHKNKSRKNSAGERAITEEDETRIGLRNGDDLGLNSVMGGKKIKRLCLFTSHYYPTKQKVRLRKDRARKMKQLRGVQIPKGVAITVQDVQNVLAKLSDDESEQNENNQNSSNCTNMSMNTSVGFYVGNVIRPDTSDANFQNMIEDLEALQVDLPKESFSEENPEIKALLPSLCELDEPLPFIDPVTDSRPSSQSREKRSRRRSGRVSGCLLPSVGREAVEQSASPGKLEPLHEPLDSEFVDAKQRSDMVETVTSQVESCVSDRQIASSTEVEIKEEITTVREGTKRRKTSREKPGKSHVNPEFSKRACEVTDSELVKKMKGNISDKEIDTDVFNSSESPNLITQYMNSSDIKSRNIFSQNEFDLPGSSELPPRETRPRMGARRQRGKRRVSGIQRSLYHSQISAALSSSGSSSPDSSLKEDMAEIDNQLANSSGCEVKGLPLSPSSQMAALSLHSDLPFTSTQDQEPQSNQLRKQRVAKKNRRRSARLSIGASSPSRSATKTNSSLGSFWSVSSPGLSSDLLKASVLSSVPEILYKPACNESSGSPPHFTETNHSKVISNTSDNNESNTPSDSSSIPLVNIVEQMTSKIEPQLQEKVIPDQFVTDRTGSIENVSGSTDLLSNLPIVNEEEDHAVPVQHEREKNVESQKSGKAKLGHHNSKQKDQCVWDAFRPKPNIKSKQELAKCKPSTTSGKPLTSTLNTEAVVKQASSKQGFKSKEKVQKEQKSKVMVPNATPSGSNYINHPSVSLSSPLVSASNFEKLELEEQKEDWDSPVISGMFEGKASIRMGKVFHNKKTSVSSPIALSPFYKPSTSIQQTTPIAQKDLPPVPE